MPFNESIQPERHTQLEEKKKLVILMTRGLDDERSSVAWSVANGGINSGLDVTVFLTSSAVDWVRKEAARLAHPNPQDPSMSELIESVRNAGCEIMVCPPCMEVRGYTPDDLIDGVIITGSPAIHDLIKQGAATLSF